MADFEQYLKPGKRGHLIGAGGVSMAPLAEVLEAMGNLYDSFTQCVAAKQAGTFTEDMIDYPTIDAGIQGLKYVEACLESNEKGNVWVTL